MAVLNKVKSWMRFMGWTQDGGPGAVKLAYGGTVVARHGDATWIADTEEACANVEREAIIAEIERREAMRGSSHGYGEQLDR